MFKATEKRSKLFKLVCAGTLSLLMVSHNAIASQSLPDSDQCINQPNTQQFNETEVACLKLKSKPVELPDEAIQKLKINAGFGWGIFNGSIYNGNEDYLVTQLTISMVPIHGHHHMKMHANMSHEPKVHQINLELPPLTKGALSMLLTGDDIQVHDFEWKIVKVTGYQTRK